MKYSIDEDYFLKELEDVYYWAGFTAADGCLSKNLRRLSFCLHPKDFEHLVKFARAIKYSKMPSMYNYTRSYESKTPGIRAGLQIDSKRFCSNLVKFNITANKTFTYVPPAIQNREMLRHFWRGYFDGDGGFYVQNNRLCFGVRGNLSTLETFRDFLFEECGLNKTKLSHDSNCYKLRYNGSTGVVAAQFLYSNCSNFLNRKMEIAKRFCYGL